MVSSPISDSVTATCTGRGAHKRRVLVRLRVQESSINGATRRVLGVTLSDSKTHRAMTAEQQSELMEVTTWRPGDDQWVFRLPACPSCGRRYERRAEPLLEIVEGMLANGDTEMDVSYL